MVLEAHCANYREKSRLEKAEIINATFTKNGDIIHTRHLEIPQRRALPGKHTQEGQTEGQRSRNDHEKGERKETAAKLRRQNHVHAGVCPLIFCNPSIQVILFFPFKSNLSSLSDLLCL